MATLASRQNTRKNWRKLFKRFDEADRNVREAKTEDEKENALRRKNALLRSVLKNKERLFSGLFDLRDTESGCWCKKQTNVVEKDGTRWCTIKDKYGKCVQRSKDRCLKGKWNEDTNKCEAGSFWDYRNPDSPYESLLEKLLEDLEATRTESTVRHAEDCLHLINNGPEAETIAAYDEFERKWDDLGCFDYKKAWEKECKKCQEEEIKSARCATFPVSCERADDESTFVAYSTDFSTEDLNCSSSRLTKEQQEFYLRTLPKNFSSFRYALKPERCTIGTGVYSMNSEILALFFTYAMLPVLYPFPMALIPGIKFTMLGKFTLLDYPTDFFFDENKTFRDQWYEESVRAAVKHAEKHMTETSYPLLSRWRRKTMDLRAGRENFTDNDENTIYFIKDSDDFYYLACYNNKGKLENEFGYVPEANQGPLQMFALPSTPVEDGETDRIWFKIWEFEWFVIKEAADRLRPRALEHFSQLWNRTRALFPFVSRYNMLVGTPQHVTAAIVIPENKLRKEPSQVLYLDTGRYTEKGEDAWETEVHNFLKKTFGVHENENFITSPERGYAQEGPTCALHALFFFWYGCCNDVADIKRFWEFGRRRRDMFQEMFGRSATYKADRTPRSFGKIISTKKSDPEWRAFYDSFSQSEACWQCCRGAKCKKECVFECKDAMCRYEACPHSKLQEQEHLKKSKLDVYSHFTESIINQVHNFTKFLLQSCLQKCSQDEPTIEDVLAVISTCNLRYSDLAGQIEPLFPLVQWMKQEFGLRLGPSKDILPFGGTPLSTFHKRRQRDAIKRAKDKNPSSKWRVCCFRNKKNEIHGHVIYSAVTRLRLLNNNNFNSCSK